MVFIMAMVVIGFSRAANADGGGEAREKSNRTIIIFGRYTSYQVNVDINGNNVFSDAANEPSIAVDPSVPDRMAIGWRQFDTITSSFREAGVAASADGGRNWTATAVLEEGVYRSDPVLGAGPDGTLYYLSLRHDTQGNAVCDMFISYDHGVTWPTKQFALGGDKAWFAVDQNNGHIYQAWSTFSNYAPSQFNRSVDGGITWETPVSYDPFGDPPAQPIYGTVDVGPNGEVYVAGVRNIVPSSTYWIARSINSSDPLQNVFFDAVRQIDLGGQFLIGAAPNPGGLVAQVNVGVDTSGGPFHGAVYVLCSVDPTDEQDPLQVHMIRSMDGGLTFSEPVRVNDDDDDTNAYQWFAAMDVAPNGRIDVIWNDTRNTGQPYLCQLFYSSSNDGGVTWSPNVAVSPGFNSFVGWPQQNKLGDYYDIRSDLVGAHVAYAATFNGEQDIYYLRIGEYDCNSNGIGDVIDIADDPSLDCTGDGIPDACQIAAGVLADENENGVPDFCQPCLADITDGGMTHLPDGIVDVHDLFALLSAWKTAGFGAEISAPPDVVDVTDLFMLLSAWGSCP